MPQNPDPSLINDDIKPTTAAERHWSVLNMASLWVGMVVCVPTYMLAAGLIKEGMSWSQAVATVMLGNVIVLAPMILNGHPGTKYGVPFPVLARASFGINGAHIPSLLRALVACGWFGIQTWVGGSAIYQLLNVLFDGGLIGDPLPLLGINAAQTASFLFFWGVQVALIYKGVESIRLLETAAAPFLIVMGLALLVWAYVKAGGFGEMLSTPSQFDPGQPREGEFFDVFFPSLTAMVGFWATLSLNIPDFTRYAKSQRDQILGQAIGLPTTMTLFAFIGVAVTSATTVIYGEAIWDPTVLLGKMGGGFSVVISLFALSVATLSTNIAANVVSPANAMINVAPNKITFQHGGYITAGLGIVMFPWKLLESTGGYIFTWLIGYSALLGPIGGILIADYFLLRKTKLDLEGLYRHKGPYTYRRGFNVAAIAAFCIAVLPNLPGFLHQAGALGGPPDSITAHAEEPGFLATFAALSEAPQGVAEIHSAIVHGDAELASLSVDAVGGYLEAIAKTEAGAEEDGGYVAAPLPNAYALWDEIYTYAWFVGFLLAGALYLLFMKLWDHGSMEPLADAPASDPAQDSADDSPTNEDPPRAPHEEMSV